MIVSNGITKRYNNIHPEAAHTMARGGPPYTIW
jgi:hypothetical protein